MCEFQVGHPGCRF